MNLSRDIVILHVFGRHDGEAARSWIHPPQPRARGARYRSGLPERQKLRPRRLRTETRSNQFAGLYESNCIKADLIQSEM